MNTNPMQEGRAFRGKRFPATITLSEEARMILRAESERTGKSGSRIIEDLLLGRDRFAPDVEKAIDSECKETGLPRAVVIERALQAFAEKRKSR